MRVVVLISGRGSNLEALLKDQQNYSISHVISNNFDAPGIKLAKQFGVTNTCIDWSDNSSAEDYLIDVINTSQTDLIVLAGFMRILSKRIVTIFHNKIINIHPSLLPKYRGLNTHQKVIDSGDELHGASVHLVDNQLDHGRILAQTQIAVNNEKNAQTLAEKLISKEHKLLTSVMGLISAKELVWDDQHLKAFGKKITKPLMIK